MKPSLNCPHCGKHNDLHTLIKENEDHPSDLTPRNGDYTMCIGCGNWSVFKHGGYQLPTELEWDNIQESPNCRKLEAAWLLMDHRRKKH